MRTLASIVLVVLLGGTQPAAGEERPIETITIKSMWGGHLEYSEIVLTYEWRDNRLYLDRYPIDSRKIQALLAALQSRPIALDEAFRSRIPQQWLDRHAHFEAGQQMDADERARFEALFRSRDFMSQMFVRLFSTVTLDDTPRVDVLISFADGEQWSAQSYSNHLFMLPWSVHRGNKTVETFDLNIAKAIGLLLPEKLRIGGDS